MLSPSHSAAWTSGMARAGVSKEAYHGLVNAAVAKSTWKKYSSAMNAFACFEASCCRCFDWPLSAHTCRAFVIWCHESRKLQKSTIRAYLSGLRFIHVLRGMPFADAMGDELVTLLLKGVARSGSEKRSSTRRVLTFPLLLLLGERIAETSWSPLNKQVVWTAATTAFFTSCRMGELLARHESETAGEDLTWNNIKETSDDSLLLRLKWPKSGSRDEFVDLFVFPGYNCCPVSAIKALRRKQLAAGMSRTDVPVFRFASGRNLTMGKMNRTLASLLSDLCQPGVNTISCHSFRAGIPTTLSLFPELASSDMIKGWGRWSSDCFEKYTRLKLSQKKKIFGSITEALKSSL